MVIFYKKWKKYNEIQLTKKKMDLNIQKMTNHPPLHQGGTVMSSQITHAQLSTIDFSINRVGMENCL